MLNAEAREPGHAAPTPRSSAQPAPHITPHREASVKKRPPHESAAVPIFNTESAKQGSQLYDRLSASTGPIAHPSMPAVKSEEPYPPSAMPRADCRTIHPIALRQVQGNRPHHLGSRATAVQASPCA